MSENRTAPHLSLLPRGRIVSTAPRPSSRKSRSIEKRVLFTKEEIADVDEFLHSLSRTVGFGVTFSHVVRAAIRLLEAAGPTLFLELKRSPVGNRPANGSETRLRQFEAGFAAVFATAVARKQQADGPAKTAMSRRAISGE